MQIIKAKNTTNIIQLNSNYYSSFQGQGAPTIIPQFVGQRYLDIIAKREYIAYGILSISDWV
jgi:hypothetical protein